MSTPIHFMAPTVPTMGMPANSQCLVLSEMKIYVQTRKPSGNVWKPSQAEVLITGQFLTNFLFRDAQSVDVRNSDLDLPVEDGDYGNIIVSNDGQTWTIADDAVTYAKLQNISAASRILGRKTDGPGNAEELTLSELLDFIGSAAQGDILFRGAAGWQRLAAGTSGKYLKTLGPGADPQWDTVTASPAFTVVDTDPVGPSNGQAWIFEESVAGEAMGGLGMVSAGNYHFRVKTADGIKESTLV